MTVAHWQNSYCGGFTTQHPQHHRMGIMSWDLDDGFSTAPLVRTPRLSIRCEYQVLVKLAEELEK